MDTGLLGIILLSVTVVSGQECTSSYPTAFMCQNSTAQGTMVVLDVSLAKETGAPSCQCSLQANMTGVIAQFDAYPPSSECGTMVELIFLDKSASFKCGAPHIAMTSTGSTATIRYSLDPSATNPDSTYCMAFNGSTTEIDLILTCYASDPPEDISTNDTTPASSSSISSSPSVATVANTSTSSLSSLTTSIPLSTASTSSTMQSTSTTSTVISTASGTSMVTSTTFTTVQTSTSSGNTLANTTSTTVSGRIISTAQTTQSSIAINTTSTTAGLISTNSTTIESNSNQTATENGTTTTTIKPDNITSLSTTTTFAGSTIKGNISTSTATQPSINVTVLETTASPTTSSISSTTLNKTAFNLNLTTTATPTNLTTYTNNNTGAITSTTATMSNATTTTEITTSGNSSISTTASPTNVTTTDNTSITTTTPANASSTAASGNVTSTTESTTTDNSTAVIMSVPSNLTTVAPDSTTDVNITTTDTTANVTDLTTALPDNVTTVADNTTSDNVTDITTTLPDNVTMVSDNKTSDNVTEITTALPDNVTTIADNTTSDNVTDSSGNDTNSQLSSTKSPGFWEPPDNYEQEETKSNNLVIILPLVAIFLLAFLGGVTFIICKRTKKAARLQRERSKQEKPKAKAAQKTTENPFLVSNYHPLPENGRDNTKSDKKELLKHEEEAVKDSQKERKYMGKDSNEMKQSKETQDEKLVKDNNNTSAAQYKKGETHKAPKLYKPTEYEKDVLENLELTSIVIEPDPEDSNRYFKKENPGDWYRVIIKGKKPKDEFGNTITSKSGKKAHRKSRSSKSGSDSKSEDSSGDKHGGGDKRKRPKSRKHKKDFDETMKSRSSIDSWDELDETMPQRAIEKMTNDSRGDHNAVSSVPKAQPRLVVSQPLSESKPTAVQSTPPATRVIMSQPKPMTTPTNTGSLQGSQKLVQMRQASAVARQPQTLQPARTVSPGAMQQSGIKQVAVKRPDIVPPLNL